MLFVINSNVIYSNVAAACDNGRDVCLELQNSIETTANLQINDATTETASVNKQVMRNALVDGITTDLKARRLTKPVGNNALEKIRKLKTIEPDHDYAINGVGYVARIYLSMARVDLKNNLLDRAKARFDAALAVSPSHPGLQAFANQLESAKLAAGSKKTDPATIKPATIKPAENAEVENARVKVEPGSKSPGIQSPGIQSNDVANGAVSSAASVTASQVTREDSPAGQSIGVITPTMVGLPAGSFVMGSESGANNEKPAHQVKVAAFSMSRYEITREQFHVYRVDIGSNAAAPELSRALLPISGVTSNEAIAYARWLSKKTGKRFRLPTEAEWEYAARANTMTPYHSGDAIFGVANCLTCLDEIPRTASPVGSFEPNAFGLYDMHGNVAEWTSSCMTENHFQTNVRTEQVCAMRVVRGGSWRSTRDQVRSSYRVGQTATARSMDTGFRLVHDGL